MLARYGGMLPIGMKPEDALKIANRSKELSEKALALGYRPLDSTASIAVANHRVYSSTTYESTDVEKTACLAVG